MTTNEVLTRQNFITKVLFKSNGSELSKSLKVKVMAMRIEYAKTRKAFDEDLQEFINGITPEEFVELQQKQDRTEAEETQLKEMIDKINSDYNEYAIKRGQEEVNITNKNLTEDEFNELLEVNVDNDVEINGQKLSAPDFLEILHTLFVVE